MIHLYNKDCMEAMASMKTGEFDLAIVDPPYGINVTKMTLGNGKNKTHDGKKNWDESIPSKEYFEELFRVSKFSIIWGANHFTPHLPSSTSWIFWDKKTGQNSFSDGELAYTNFGGALRKYTKLWLGSNAQDKDGRIHPTQKPVALYTWLLDKYAQKGWKILDTHLGSGSSAIAAHDLGYEFHGYELDEEYYEAASNRLKEHQKQLQLF